MSIFQVHEELAGIEPEILFKIGNFPIASSTMMTVALLVFLLVAGILFKKKAKLIPGPVQSAIEMAYEMLLNFIISIVGHKKGAHKIFPIVGALFVFILVSNLFGLIPIISSITFGGIAIFRPATTDFNTTVGLALGSIIFLQVISMFEWGPIGHILRFIKIKELIHGFKHGLAHGFLGLVEFFVGIMEMIGEISRIISLSFRLFGNMYAHEILAIIILGAFSYVLPVAWSFMGLLVGFIQAVVFVSLVTIYYSLQANDAHSKGYDGEAEKAGLEPA